MLNICPINIITRTYKKELNLMKKQKNIEVRVLLCPITYETIYS